MKMMFGRCTGAAWTTPHAASPVAATADSMNSRRVNVCGIRACYLLRVEAILFPHPRRKAEHARTASGPPLRRSHASAQRRSDVRHRGVARDRDRRQHRDLQRRQRAAAEAAAVSGARPSGGPLAPVAGHQHPAGLAVARPLHRHADRESVVRRDVDLAGTDRDAHRPGTSASASRRWRPRRACSSCSARRPLNGRLLLPEDDGRASRRW